MNQPGLIEFGDCKDGDTVIAIIYCPIWHDKMRISVFRVTHTSGDGQRFLLSNDARINGNKPDLMHGYTHSWEVVPAYYERLVVRLPCAKPVSSVIELINNSRYIGRIGRIG